MSGKGDQEKKRWQSGALKRKLIKKQKQNIEKNYSKTTTFIGQSSYPDKGEASASTTTEEFDPIVSNTSTDVEHISKSPSIEHSTGITDNIQTTKEYETELKLKRFPTDKAHYPKKNQTRPETSQLYSTVSV